MSFVVHLLFKLKIRIGRYSLGIKKLFRCLLLHSFMSEFGLSEKNQGSSKTLIV